MKQRSDWKPDGGPAPVYHDLQAPGRELAGDYELNRMGTVDDLAKYGIELREGMRINLYCDDSISDDGLDELIAEGVVRRDAWGEWVAHVEQVRYLSDEIDLTTLAQQDKASD